MEANIKLTHFGSELKLTAKIIKVEGEVLEAKQMHNICSRLGKSYSIAATPYKENELIVEHRENVPLVSFLVEGDWKVTLKSTNDLVTLDLVDSYKRLLLIDLYQRALLIQTSKLDGLEKMNDSPRIFWNKKPVDLSDYSLNNKNSKSIDVHAFRRYEIAAVFLEDLGLGFSVESTTAFKSICSVQEYFLTGNSKRFFALTARQKEHKGTLIYHGPNGKVKCYFEKYCADKTLIQTPAFAIGSKYYNNSYEYYKKEYPNYKVKPDDTVALVSFTGGLGSKYVPAKYLFLRIMNNMVDGPLSQIDKINPDEREKLVNIYWQMLGAKPFGKNYVGVNSKLYEAPKTKSGVIQVPDLVFGNGKVLSPPESLTPKAYRKHYNLRKDLLDQHGCYYISPSTQTTLYIVFDDSLDPQVTDRFENDIKTKMSLLMRKDIEIISLFSSHYLEATAELNRNVPGIVLFVFKDDQSAIYNNIAFELKNWKLKRITTQTMNRRFQKLINPDPGKEKKGLKDWQSFVDMNAYALLRSFGCVPFALNYNLNYDAHLVIDVSEKHHYIGLALYIHRLGRIPILDTVILPKADKKKESINPAFLEHHLISLFKEKSEVFKVYNVKSLLIKRDGQDLNDEHKAIKDAITNSIDKGYLCKDFSYTFVEYHKSTQKKLRLWNRENYQVINVLEGSYLILENKTAILTPTGAGTLNRGTAEPIMIRTITECDILKVLEDIFICSQLNYASPGTAQRLTVDAELADDMLREKMSMEILRIS